jgi:Tfp pilus assembly protein FimT
LEAICRLPDEVSLQKIVEKIEFFGLNLRDFAWPFFACHSPGLCYNARSSSTLMFPREASKRLCAGGCLPRPSEAKAGFSRRILLSLQRERASAFTLLELLIVIGIIALLLVLIAPAFTNLKSAGDVTSAVYGIKGVLDTARTYATANDTYTWVGFAGSIGPNQQQYVTGQVKLAVVASKDGTNLWSANNVLPSDKLTQVGKVITLNNIHVGDTGVPQNDGSDFESRPAVDDDHRISTSANTPYPFTVQQTTFDKWIQFSPRGEALIHGGNFSIVKAAEVGVLPTHGNTLAATQDGNQWLGNIAAIQVSGFGGDIRIYRR